MDNRKRTEVIQRISTYFLSMDPGDNIDSMREMSRKMEASLGLVSEAISEIEQAGGISLEKRGQLGSFIRDMSIGRLWHFASDEPLVIAHTLPSNRRYEGLATALKAALQAAGVEAYFIFIRGSRTRINALRERRCHIAITSRFAAEGLCGKREEIVLTLPSCTFTSAHHLYTRNNVDLDAPSTTVAVDPDSYDQKQLSEIEFSDKKVKFEQINFMNIYRCLESGEVDAAIWTEDDMQPHLNGTIIQKPLSAHTVGITNQSDTQAALIQRRNDPLPGKAIEKAITFENIIKTQEEVISGKRIPAY